MRDVGWWDCTRDEMWNNPLKHDSLNDIGLNIKDRRRANELAKEDFTYTMMRSKELIFLFISIDAFHEERYSWWVGFPFLFWTKEEQHKRYLKNNQGWIQPPKQKNLWNFPNVLKWNSRFIDLCSGEPFRKTFSRI